MIADLNGSVYIARIALVSGIALAFAGGARSENLEFDPLAFIEQHCVKCHGEEKQKGDRRFDSLGIDFTDEDTAYDWQEILDMLNLGEMPPEDEPAPSGSDIKSMVDWASRKLEIAYELHREESTTQLRRLNRFEYLNTIRDLYGINIESFDPTSSFPPDERKDGFENIGDVLGLSDYLLEKYLEAASATVEKAFQAKERVEPIHEVFVPDDLCDTVFQFRPQIFFEVNVDGRYVDVGHGDSKSFRVYADRFKGVPADGYYTIRIEADAINRVHPYDPRVLGMDMDEPLKMQVIVTDPEYGYPGRRYNASDRVVAIIPLKDHEQDVYEVRAWMDKGYVPVLRFANGPQPFKVVLTRIAPVHHKEVLPSNWRDGVAAKPAENQEIYLSDVYEGPRMRIYNMEIEGPEPEAFRSRGANEFASIDAARESIDAFLVRAFRRTPLASEQERYERFFQGRVDDGEDLRTALKTTYKAILCSPNFLYIEAPQTDPEIHDSKFEAFALASRLSYFMWSSMPDDALMDAASSGALESREQVVAQVERMLDDPKSFAFVEQFTDSWLHLNELGSMPPDSKKFAVYHKRELEPLMKEETRLFFADVLKRNLSIRNFLDSDFTYLNRYLADLYGIEGVAGDAFRRVTLDSKSDRGGLLTQASILTATSNGVETSPVTRGIWVLENILGTPPAPPPPDVEPIEPDIRGAVTIRDQLIKHRDVETCADCHRKIDPIGFALESYDPIGMYRKHYQDEKGKRLQKVDTTGKLVTGHAFRDTQELKQLLVEREDQFARCLVEKMLTYGLGRELGFQDRPEIDRITNDLIERGYGLRDLVELVATSAPFLERGSAGAQNLARNTR